MAKAAAVSRCTLERKFRVSIGKTIGQEIRRHRADHICRLLTETEMSIEQIAQALGYQEAKNLARFFKQEKQTTPLAYRNKSWK